MTGQVANPRNLVRDLQYRREDQLQRRLACRVLRVGRTPIQTFLTPLYGPIRIGVPNGILASSFESDPLTVDCEGSYTRTDPPTRRPPRSSEVPNARSSTSGAGGGDRPAGPRRSRRSPWRFRLPCYRPTRARASSPKRTSVPRRLSEASIKRVGESTRDRRRGPRAQLGLR